MSEKQVREVLDNYSKLYGKIRVATRIDGKWWKYFEYPSKDYDDFFMLDSENATDREILHNEIVVESDLDLGSKIENCNGQFNLYTKYIYPTLYKKEITHNVWYSGNKSYHIHTFFDKLKDYQGNDLKLIKTLFIMWLFKCDKSVDNCNECPGLYSNGEICLLKRFKIDMQLSGKHMIRIEHGYNWKSDNHKRLIRKVIFKELNKLPLEVIVKFKYLKAKQIQWEDCKTNLKILKPMDKKCLNYFLNTKLVDCRKRVMFILIRNLLKQYSRQEVEMIMLSWNKLQDNYLSFTDLNSAINYAIKCNRNPGCKYIKEIIIGIGRYDLCERCQNEHKSKKQY